MNPLAENSTMINRLLKPVGDCLTPEVAKRIVDLRADGELQAEVDRLADKANAGTLTAEERSDYEQYVNFWQFITQLQIQARDVINSSSDVA